MSFWMDLNKDADFLGPVLSFDLKDFKGSPVFFDEKVVEPKPSSIILLNFDKGPKSLVGLAEFTWEVSIYRGEEISPKFPKLSFRVEQNYLYPCLNDQIISHQIKSYSFLTTDSHGCGLLRVEMYLQISEHLLNFTNMEFS